MTVTNGTTVSSPWRLTMRRWRYQFVPVATMLVCAALAAWLWSRNARAFNATGEVSTIRVELESKIPGLLEEIPQPVRVFDAVRSGQIVARVDLSLVEKRFERLQAELERLRSQQPAPSAATVAEREAEIAELRAQLDAREIRSPIDGTVMRILERPGQSAQPGLPIMIIAADRSDFIIGYIRDGQRLRPAPGMAVTIRPRSDPRRITKSYVDGVAPQVELLPQRHRLNPDPNIQEWGLPVQIAIPKDADLRPGEMLDLTFHP
jgi:multidrug resistance efflux pump